MSKKTLCDSKIKILLADDQFASGIQKLQTFFSYTHAPLRTDALEREKEAHLAITRDHPGVELGFLTPRKIFDLKEKDARNTVFLVDLNWEDGRSLIPNSETMGDETIQTYGFRLIEHLLGILGSSSNSWIVVYSHSRADKVSDFYDAWIDRGYQNIRQVVDPRGDRVNERVWKCYVSIVNQILTRLPGAEIPELFRLFKSVDPVARLLDLGDFAGKQSELRVDGFLLRDLAVPFLERIEKLRREPDANGTIRETYNSWFFPLLGKTLFFELPEENSNLSIQFMKEIFRYGKLHVLEGILYFRDITERWAKPVGYLENWLGPNGLDSKNDPIPLKESFARIFQIHLGSFLDEGKCPAGFPEALKDPEKFSVSRSRGNPDAVLFIEKKWPWVTLRIRKEVAIENRYLSTRFALECASSSDFSGLIGRLEEDPNHLELLVCLAENHSKLMKKNSGIDQEKLRLLRNQWSLWRNRLRDAICAMDEYRQGVESFTEAERLRYGKLRRSKKLLAECVDAQSFLDKWKKISKILDNAIQTIDRELFPDPSIGDLLEMLSESGDIAQIEGFDEFINNHFRPLIQTSVEAATYKLNYMANKTRDKTVYFNKLRRALRTYYPANDFAVKVRNVMVPLQLSILDMRKKGYSPGAFSVREIRKFLVPQIIDQLINDADLFEGQVGVEIDETIMLISEGSFDSMYVR